MLFAGRHSGAAVQAADDAKTASTAVAGACYLSISFALANSPPNTRQWPLSAAADAVVAGLVTPFANV